MWKESTAGEIRAGCIGPEATHHGHAPLSPSIVTVAYPTGVETRCSRKSDPAASPFPPRLAISVPVILLR